MYRRSSGIGMVFDCSTPNAARLTSRSRNGALCGAPASRWPPRCGSDVTHHDVGIAQRGAAQHGLQTLDERGVAAPVDVQRAPFAGGAGGLQVGVDVAAAKAVDRLLGIADQHHRGVTAERALDDLPLNGIGVLELVDHDDRPARPHPVAGIGILRLQRRGEPA